MYGAQLCSMFYKKNSLMSDYCKSRLMHDAIVQWLAYSTSDREVVGSNPAGCGPSRSNRGPVAPCILAYSTLHLFGVGK